MGAFMLKGFMGVANTARATWLTENTARAIARITQLEERERNPRALEIFQELRETAEETYTLIVLLGSMRVFPGGGGAEFGAPTPERLAKIFLEDSKNKNRFVRAVDAGPLPFSADEVYGKRAAGASGGFIIRFSRNQDDGSPLITSLKQSVTLNLPTDAGRLKVKFKLSKFKLQDVGQL